MLKWAVNGPIRQSYLPTFEDNKLKISSNKIAVTPNSVTKKRIKRPLKRKSSSNNDAHVKVAWYGKDEYRYTSTPLQQQRQQHNVAVENQQQQQHHVHHYDSQIVKSSELKADYSLKQLPTTYASTLPTYEVEYSPCNNMIPGPILALRGIGLPDNYFEKPRYLNSDKEEQQSNVEHTNTHCKLHTPNKTSIMQSSLTSFVNHNDNEESLSSSKMGDATLERMIDAIIASTRKERKMLPTYTPADDPASDLHELWDQHQQKINYQQECQNEKHSNTQCKPTTKNPCQRVLSHCNSMQTNRTMLLKRQRAIRRKRKTIASAYQVVTNRQHNSVRAMQEKKLNDMKVKTEKEILENVNENKIVNDNVKLIVESTLLRISPDSGHNSASEYDDEEKENDPANRIRCVDITKRRLSFSTNETF